MILDFFTTNFLTLMLMSALIVMMVVNRKLKIPATQMFYVLIAVVLLLSVLDFLDDFLAGDFSEKPAFDPVVFRTVVDWLLYILRPVVILIELLVILPKLQYRLLCTIPAIINAIIFSTAFFGSEIAFHIDANGWQGGPLKISVFVVQILYVALLAVCSIIYFGHGNLKRAIIILMIVLMAVVTTILESTNILNGQSTVVAAFCVVLYYIYLSGVYEQEIRELFEEKGLHIAKQELLLLRSGIRADFIFESLNIIRALAKTDKKASAAAIDSFSSYLRAHLNAIRDDVPMRFEWELESVKAYLALVKIIENKQIELICDLQYTDFSLPQLFLESVTDYCIHIGTGSTTLMLKSYEAGNAVNISLTGENTELEQQQKVLTKDLEIALGRLEMQCAGTFITTGNSVNITIPIRN